MAPVALVTGASRGVGAAAAIGLAKDGHDVAVAYRREHAAAQAVVEEITGLGRRAIAVSASLADADGPSTLAAATLETFGRIDVVAHCAGVACPAADVVDTPVDEYERQLAVHFWGPLRLTQLLVPRLRKQDRGAVVFVSSAVTGHMRATGSPYNVAKAAMEALARTLANEERAHGIRVNIVAPGLVDTELGRRFVRWAHGRDIHELGAVLPFGRVCTPDDVAACIRWLASPGADYLSGVTITVNGGDDEVASNVHATRVALDERAQAEPAGATMAATSGGSK